MTNHTPVTGPFRITVEPIPTGVTLDVGAFVEHVVHDVVAALLNDDTYADRFDALQDMQPQDPHQPERSLPFEELVADLVAVAGTKMPVYGLQALALAGHVEQLAAPVVAALQAAEGGAAA
ncbi:hypothetical protein Zmor_008831 [Zophobas morio]|uniref:Uncharacterized protein n=1 Tax=Zophobas morio TaxID=2755281 RepID=A0AA38M0N4_9CUCU|nr:hypothetical protein [Streptomyces sp. NRRL F-5650]KAJ3617289.1 hypothetical protein Zmor_008831 [Zophobas morio]